MGTIGRLVGYLGRARNTAITAIVALIISNLLGLASPRLVQAVIDQALTAGSPSLLGLLSMAVLGVAVISAVLAFIQRFAMARAVNQTVYEIRNELYDHIIRLSFSFHDRSRTGQLVSRMSGDIDQISFFLGFGLSNLLGMVFMLVGSAVMLFSVSPTFGLMGLASLPLMGFIAVSGSGRLGPRFYKLRGQFGRMTAQIQENFAGVRVVKAFAREEHEIGRLRKELVELMNQQMGIIRIFSTFMPGMGLLSNLTLVLILLYGGMAVIQGTMTVGELVAAQGYLMMLVGPIRMIGFMVVVGRRATAAGERIFEIMDTQPDVVESGNAIDKLETQGEVTFEHVHFAYEEGKDVLSDINFTAHPGETIALLGATGSGKTSIINLIPRFYDATQGRVLLDGVDVRDLTLSSLRSHISIISQEALLFTGTIGENIAFGNRDATQEQIEAAAKAAQAHDFILEFAHGYDTEVGERGATLSGGQRQRVTIARALLVNAPILIMDDSTSSVDVETEYLIQVALHEAMRERTSFVIAHRLSTVKNADHILVLDAGKIVEAGTHESLIAEDGYYRRIYETQFAEQEEEAANL